MHQKQLTDHTSVDHMPWHVRLSQRCWFATIDHAIMETESTPRGNAKYLDRNSCFPPPETGEG